MGRLIIPIHPGVSGWNEENLAFNRYATVAETETGRASLTTRELEVLTWVAQGKSALEIGKILQITKRTVDEHVRSAVRKLDTLNRTHAVAVALRGGLIEF